MKQLNNCSILVCEVGFIRKCKNRFFSLLKSRSEKPHTLIPLSATGESKFIFSSCFTKRVLSAFFIFFFLPAIAFSQSLYYNIDFSGGMNDLSSFTKGTSESYSLTMSSDIERDGNPSARFELRYGDPEISGSARSEINNQPGVLPKEIWIGYSLYLPASWTPDNQPEITGQVHDEGNVSPLIALLSNNGHSYLAIKYSNNSDGSNVQETYKDLGTTITGKWVDYVMHLKITNSSNSLVEVWQDGTKVVSYTGMIGSAISTTPYVKFGIYKWPWAQSGQSQVSTRVAYYDDIKMAGSDGSYALVAPPAAQGTNQPPVANAGSDSTITLPDNTVTLLGNASSDKDGSISSYSWTKISGPSQYTINSPGSAKTTVSNLAAGTYEFSLKVTDNAGATDTAHVAVVVNSAANQSPVADAGSNTSITLPTNSVKLNGSGSSDPDGSIASYRWAETSGPSQYNINSPGTSSTTVSNLVSGTYVFTLKVTDNDGATATDNISVIVNAAVTDSASVVVVDAGEDTTLMLPDNSITLSGTAADTVANDNIASYHWTKIEGPAQYYITAPASATTNLTNLVSGTYQMQLSATDASGDVGMDTVAVVVSDTTVLPVTLKDFTVREYNKKAILRWTSTSETNSDHFEIERSSDGKFFETIGKVSTKGGINLASAYTFIDVLPVQGESYYRLKIVDKDGSVDYSNTISLQTAQVDDFSVDKVILSPYRNNMELTITSSKAQNIHLSVVDVSGKVLFTEPLSLNEGVNTFSSTVTGLYHGVFYVNFSNTENSITKTVFAGHHY